MVAIALFSWIPITFFLFVMLPKRRALGLSIIFGWLFLPITTYTIVGFLDYSKTEATCFSAFIVAAVLDKNRALWRYRPAIFDLPMLIWCLCPLATSIVNGLGVYDGLSSVLSQMILWGLPYVMGRVYFSDVAGLREIALLMFIGGLVYVPLCLYEIRMSPQLHNHLYGFHQHLFSQTIRFDGWRPTVFLSHGLEVGFLMCTAGLIGVWLWYSKPSQLLPGLPSGLLVVLLLITNVLVKSVAALIWLIIGLAVLFGSKRFRTPILALCLVLIPFVYIWARTVSGWSGDELLRLAQRAGLEDRVESLQTRLTSEYHLLRKARARPLLGWGGWKRSLVGDVHNKLVIEDSVINVIPDSFWIIIFGRFGLVGLAAGTSAILMPLLLLICRVPARDWSIPEIAPAAALTVALGLYMLDNLLNNMPSPIFSLVVGGTTGMLSQFPLYTTNKIKALLFIQYLRQFYIRQGNA